MPRDPDYPQRNSPRLDGYDYAQEGAYFVTICTQKHQYLFGTVVDGMMQLNQYGHIVWRCWLDLPNHYPHIELDAFVVMPNHVHGIVVIVDQRKHGLPEIIRALKSFATRRIYEQRNTPGTKVWQRSYHDHIIRNEADLDRLRKYTVYNPALWEADRFYSVNDIWT